MCSGVSAPFGLMYGMHVIQACLPLFGIMLHMMYCAAYSTMLLTDITLSLGPAMTVVREQIEQVL